MTKSTVIFFSITLLTSCVKTYTLKEKDYAWMPYKGNEVLVFTSNTGDQDTVFLLKKDTIWGYFNEFSSSKYETVSVFCKHSDPSPPDLKHRYLENVLFEISKGKDGKTELDIEFTAKDAWFYRISKIKIDSLEKVSPKSLATNYCQYNDVYIFDGEDYINFYERSNFITKLYWSKSAGIVRYDKKDLVYWELSKKIN